MPVTAPLNTPPSSTMPHAGRSSINGQLGGVEDASANINQAGAGGNAGAQDSALQSQDAMQYRDGTTIEGVTSDTGTAYRGLVATQSRYASAATARRRLRILTILAIGSFALGAA